MSRATASLGLLGLLLAALLLLPAPAWALRRTFVSGSGSDTNPCTLTAPCRDIARGLARADVGGEVVVLDSADYSPFTVRKAVTVVAAPGVHAGITVTTGTGITVNAGATGVVILRGLTLAGMGGSDGIVFQAGQALHVEHMVIHGFSIRGIDQRAGRLVVKDTVIRSTSTGVFIRGPAGLVQASLERVRLVGNSANGLVAHDNAQVTIRDCIAAGNGDGLRANSVSAAAELNIENCVATNNTGAGIRSAGGFGLALVRVSNSTVTNNGIGLAQAGAGNDLLSRTNNTVEGNTTPTAGTIGTFDAE